MIRVLVIAALLAGCGGSVATTPVPTTTVEATPLPEPSPTVEATPSVDLAVCEVYRDAADSIRKAISALMANSTGSGPSQDVIGPILDAQSELGIIGTGLSGDELTDVEALSEGIRLNNEGDGFLANLTETWGTFYRKYAEPCGQEVVD